MKPFGIIMFVACLLVTSVRADYWSALQQTQRDQAILTEALKYPEGAWGGVNYKGEPNECKGWVQKVVYDASRKLVSLPLNQPAPNYEFWQNSTRVSGFCASPQMFQPGWIIQMRYYSQTTGALLSGHTAIVINVTSTGINFIECNWQKDNRVYRRKTVSFADFLKQTKGYYTVYQTR
jgi:hypothetical protein